MTVLNAVVGEVGVEILPRLILQLQPVHEKQDARGVLGAEIQLGDGRAQERLARAGGHLEEKPMQRRRSGLLQLADGVDLVVAQQADFLVHHHRRALGGRIGEPRGILRHGDVILIHRHGGEPGGIGPPLRRLAELFQRQEARHLHRIALPQIPVVMHQPVAEEDVADAEAFRVAARLLLAGERVNALALGFRRPPPGAGRCSAARNPRNHCGACSKSLPKSWLGEKARRVTRCSQMMFSRRPCASGRKRQPASSSSLLMVMRAWASEGMIRVNPSGADAAVRTRR